MPREIVEEKNIPLSVARVIIEERLSEGETLDIQRRAYSYLVKFSKCDPEKATKLIDELISEFSVSPTTAVIIANTVPSSIEELRTILAAEEKVYTTKEVEKILEKVLDYCSE